MATQTTTFTPSFGLYKYLMTSAGPQATTVIGGSAAPALSIADIISLSIDPEKTREILTESLISKKLGLGSNRGSPALREVIASTYLATSNVKSDNILVTNGTSGANHIVEQSVLAPGDHVIVQYPVYGPCIEEPLAIGCTLSYLRGDPSNHWQIDTEELKGLIRPGKTKMLFFNNPGNPTGAFIDSSTQRSIISIAKQYDLVIHCDEIFRPLFHSPDLQHDQAPSFVEHSDLGYEKIVVTGSLSKCYGLSGVRIGWITTPCQSLYSQFESYRMLSVHSLPQIDEAIATEVLSPRCRPAILQKHLDLAKHNLDLIDAFAMKHPASVEWKRPKTGAVAFVKFLDSATGKGRDDVDFCKQLAHRKGVLLSPGTLCFEFNGHDKDKVDEFKGRVRLHFTCSTEVLEAGLRGITEFLDEESN